MIDLTDGALASLPGQRAFTPPMLREGDADGSIRLTPLVDLDLSTERFARAELAAACETPGRYRWIVVNGAAEWFVDVRGLAALLDSAALAHVNGRELVVLRAPKSLQSSVAALELGDQIRLIGDISELTP